MKVSASKQWGRSGKTRAQRIDADFTVARFNAPLPICLHLSTYETQQHTGIFDILLTSSQAALLAETLARLAAKIEAAV